MQRNTIRLFLVSISLLTLMPQVTVTWWSEKYVEERINSLKQILASLTPQNVDQKIDQCNYRATPLQILTADKTYHENMSPQEYEQHIDHLLALGADPCAESPKNWVLTNIASQGNYTIFKKIVSHIAPKDIDSKTFKETIIFMLTFNMQTIRHTPDTLQILSDLIDLGVNVHAQDCMQRTVLFSSDNTPETLQFFLDRGVDPSKKDYAGKTCLDRHQVVMFGSTKSTQPLVKTLLLNQAFDASHVTQEADGITTPGWKGTLFGKIFVHACLECFKGNPELLQTIVIESNKNSSLAGKLERLLSQDKWATFLIPAITSQLPEDEQELFLAQVPNNLKTTVAQQHQANQESPE